MSWDISIQRFSRVYTSISDISDGEKGLPLGQRRLVQEAVSAIFPGTNWSDPAWGTWDSPFGSIEFNVGEDPAQGMMLHVRAGVEVVPAIVQLCKMNGWQGIDCGTGDFLEQSVNPAAGLEAWSAFRDHVLSQKK